MRSLHRLALIAVAALAISLPHLALAKGDAAPSVDYDPYTKTTVITGASHNHNALFDPIKTMWWLSSVVVDTSVKFPTLTLWINMPDWMFIDQAYDIDSFKLNVLQNRRDIEGLGGGVTEVVSAELPLDYITRHMQTGMNVKFVGSRGAYVVVVPVEAMQAFFPTFEARTGVKIIYKQ